ncbi:hypothetical protein AAG570_005768 [Ranatra chinensis]|uniref:Uncharacterized protein n=1 Tax=Ranatra chinensis TaxID=642074 RepID=A0ABD0XYR1_9HEMI
MEVLFADNAYLSVRLREIEGSYPEPPALGDCDCTSYSYFMFSIMLLTVGTLITVPALGGVEHFVFSNLGHMWLVGPVCICSGVMVAIKSLLYLRRKSMIQMMLRRRALIRSLQELARQTMGPETSLGQGCGQNASTLTLPPSYEALALPDSIHAPPTTELPPPTYAEAMLLITSEKGAANQQEPQ